MTASTCAMLGFASHWHPVGGIVPAGGLVGLLLAEELVASMNLTGAMMLAVTCWILGLYLVSTFEMAILQAWIRTLIAKPAAFFRGISARFYIWTERRAVAKARAKRHALRRALQQRAPQAREDEATTAASQPAGQYPAETQRRGFPWKQPPLRPPHRLRWTLLLSIPLSPLRRHLRIFPSRTFQFACWSMHRLNPIRAPIF